MQNIAAQKTRKLKDILQLNGIAPPSRKVERVLGLAVQPSWTENVNFGALISKEMAKMGVK